MLSKEDARRLLTEPSAQPLWQIAHSLDKSGDILPGGVPPELIANVLEVADVETWPTTGRSPPPDAGSPFRPFATRSRDGRTYRTFLPEDLRDEDEPALRAFADSCRNPLVRTRVYEVLSARFRKFADAKLAIEARFDAANLLDPLADWPEVVKNLGKLAALLVQYNQTGRYADYVAAADATRVALLAGPQRFAFPVLADTVSNTILAKRAGRESFGPDRAERWTEDLRETAEGSRGDPELGHRALIVLAAWLARWGDTEGNVATRRRVVEHLLSVANDAQPMMKSHHCEKALDMALEYGLADLVEVCRQALNTSIREEVPLYGRVSSTFELPREWLTQLDVI